MMMNNFFKNSKPRFLVIFLFFAPLVLDTFMIYAKTTIKVESQKDFDSLSKKIVNALSKGDKDVIVDFSRGHYYYKQQHINFAGKVNPGVSIQFRGNGSTIVSAGNDLINGSSVVFFKEAGFIDSNGKDYQNYSQMFQSDSMVEILDEKTKQCRIHCYELKQLDFIDCTNIFIRLTSWYTSFLYQVDKISDSYVYFTASNLSSGYSWYGNYNVNYDLTVGKLFPRFRLVNAPVNNNAIVSLPHGLTNTSSNNTIHRCETGYFITFSKSQFKRVTIEGFNIIGCRSDCRVIQFHHLKAESIEIKKTKISGARGITVYVDNTDNVKIESCEFYDNYKDVIYITNTCANTSIINNKFHNNGKGVIGSFCILCRGSNYYIAKNDIFDFNYGAIGVGVHYSVAKGSHPSYGIIEKNHIYYTPMYLKDKYSWTLIDSGAIYVWSKNDGVIIRNNFIHDYEGMGSNRGIYCDDGTSNCTIYGNIILDIGNCYSIDLRQSLSLDDLKIGLKSNVNNQIYGNCFNNRFRFQGRKDDSSSIKGGNTILIEDENNMPNIIEDNLVEKTKDSFVKFDKQKWYKKGLRLVR